jgi:PAS domain S-box-containing protein
MAAQPLEVILMRELAAHLSTPIFVVDPDGNLLFYNEPAEALLGSRFEETGGMAFPEWATLFTPTDEEGAPLAPEELPLSITMTEQRPVQGRIWISALDGKRRRLDVTAVPLKGQWGQHLGAAAIFWEA